MYKTMIHSRLRRSFRPRLRIRPLHSRPGAAFLSSRTSSGEDFAPSPGKSARSKNGKRQPSGGRTPLPPAILKTASAGSGRKAPARKIPVYGRPEALLSPCGASFPREDSKRTRTRNRRQRGREGATYISTNVPRFEGSGASLCAPSPVRSPAQRRQTDKNGRSAPSKALPPRP